MKLELKHLAPYLPYGLKFYVEHLDGTQLPSWTITIDSNIRQVIEFQNRPILRPLSNLTKEVEIDNVKFVPYYWFEKLNYSCSLGFGTIKFEHKRQHIFYLNPSDYESINELPYEIVVKLIEWNFDIFGLIEKGLAIDINSLENEAKRLCK